MVHPVQASGRLFIHIEDMILRIQMNQKSSKSKSFESISAGITFGEVAILLDQDQDRDEKLKIDLGSFAPQVKNQPLMFH